MRAGRRAWGRSRACACSTQAALPPIPVVQLLKFASAGRRDDRVVKMRALRVKKQPASPIVRSQEASCLAAMPYMPNTALPIVIGRMHKRKNTTLLTNFSCSRQTKCWHKY